MPGDTEIEKKLSTFKDSWKAEAERLVLEEFPIQILEIDKHIQSKPFQLSRATEIAVPVNIPLPDVVEAANGDVGSTSQNSEVPNKKRKLDSIAPSDGQVGTKIYAFSSGNAPSNEKITELVAIVQPIVRAAVEHVNKVKMWILFLIPRIEDGNNFGVSIQEETLAEVRTVEAEAASFLDQISRYFLTRGRIVCKIARYPHVEDYRRSIADLDEKEFLNLRLVLMEIRNHYSTLHDMITKNIEKIKIPRTTNLNSLY